MPGLWTVPGICLALAALVFIVFGQTAGEGFVNYDDGIYIYNNPVVSQGLSLGNIGWAFTHIHGGNWHPLTTMVHMLDCQLYGLWPGGHHLTNVFIHAACAVCLFLMLLHSTGAVWPCAFVAAVFAVHPLRVESVAWVSELKDVLSGLFFMLTLWAYMHRVRERYARHYAAVMVWFVLGLLSKPMLVTVPFVLLLLDYWPLGRLRSRVDFSVLVREKVPLLALSALSCAATIIAQKGAIQPIAHVPFLARLGNASVAYAFYLWKLVWPTRLAALYPLPQGGPAPWQVLDSILIITALTAGGWLMRRRQPWLLMGWLWYLGMLVPVIGIMQVGHQVYADRYTYLPEIGLCIAATWTAAEWAGRWRGRRAALRVVAAIILCVLPIGAWRQVGYWHDSISLWTHTLESTQDNWLAHINLANALRRQGRPEEAITQYQEAVAINPADAEAWNNLGNTFCETGRPEEGIAQYRQALKIDPDYLEARDNLATALVQTGRIGEAIAYAEDVASRHPNDPNILHTLGTAYARAGRLPDAIRVAQRALQLAQDQSNPALEAALLREIQVYQSGPAPGSQ